MRRFHPEEYATFFPDKPDAKVRHTATGLAALEGTAGTDLEAEMEACVIRMAPGAGTTGMEALRPTLWRKSDGLVTRRFVG